MDKVKVCILLLFLFTISSIIVDVVPQDMELKYEDEGKRNPFIPMVTDDGQLLNIDGKEEDTELNLEGIIYDTEGQSMAIINGEILRKNDSIGNVKIIEVRRDSVVYVKGGEVFTLNAEEEE